MQTPLQITFHNLAPSEALSEVIRQETAKLEERCPRLVGCRVAVEQPNHHHRHGNGNHFRVRVELSVPGEFLIADGDTLARVSGEDAYAAVARAFSAARRLLVTYSQRNGWEKPHQRRAKRSRPWLES